MSRLQFYNLREQYDLNALSKTVQSQIWVPALSFPNARQAEGTLVDELTLTRILKNGEPLADSTQNAVEALIYEGIDSRNSVSQIPWCWCSFVSFPATEPTKKFYFA